MMNDFQCTGVWWLPDAPNSKTAGTLSYSRKLGLKLRLVGTLGEFATVFEPRTYPVVLGLVNDLPLGRYVTLHRCLQSSLTLSAPGFATEEVEPTWALCGAHVDQPASERFHRARLNYGGLDSWVRHSGFSLVVPSGANRTVHVEYTLPDRITADARDVTVAIGFTLEQKFRSPHEVHLLERVYIEVESAEGLTVDRFGERIITPLRNLLTLATDRASALSECSFLVLEEKSERRVKPEQQIHLVWREIAVADRDERPKLPNEMLFSLADVIDDFEPIMRRWFDVSSELRPVCDAFFGLLYPDLRVEERLLGVVRALELYHRYRYGEGRLAERLRDLMARHEKQFAPLAPGGIDGVVTDVMQARNSLLHMEPDASQEAVIRLYWLSERLILLMKACLLEELRIPVERHLAFLQRIPSYIRLRSQDSTSA